MTICCLPSFLGKPLNPENLVQQEQMSESKHLISVRYHRANHINLQGGDVAMLSELEGVQIHALITIKLCVF